MVDGIEKEQEINRLNAIIKAYESLTAVSRKELSDLHTHIHALESDRDELLSLVRNIIDNNSSNEAELLQQCERIKDQAGSKIFVHLFRVLMNHQFDENRAEEYWNEVLHHKSKLEKQLGRPVGFRVALLDYFTNINNILVNPGIIEIDLIDEIMRNTMLDDLTGLYNRRFYSKVLQSELNRAKRHRVPVSLFVLDLDNFKNINDDYGHDTGDQVLKTTGSILKESFRTEDHTCRIGGEEFAVVLPHTTSQEASIVAERFRSRIESAEILDRSITISGGISVFPDDSNDSQGLYKKADEALYRAKSAGKNTVICAI